MNTQRRTLKIKTLRSETGQGTVEYILILLIAITVATLLSKGVSSIWQGNVNKMGGNMEQSLKTGRLPTNAWKQ
jgi:Flp pilus assembly pilin Flp